jgi:glycerol-3-phosphate dehydrogenase
VKGFINVAGIQSPGLTASPAIAEYVRDILKEEGLVLEEKTDFRAHVPCAPRFSAADLDERERLVAENPLFARVVCRCELVTEAEVQDAIDRGARTLDGIKFRTRAGMGRCQGGFCTSRCMKLLAERSGVPLHAITKRGGGSWVVAEMINAQHPRAVEGEESSC